MKRFLKFTVSVISLCAALNGCTVDKVSPPKPIPQSPVVIKTGADGARIASQVNQAQELVYNSTAMLKELGSLGIDVMVSNPTVTSPAPVACADYGEYTYTGSVDASGSYSLTLTFSLCRVDGVQYDGAYTLTGTPGNIAVTLGSSSAQFRVVEFSNRNYDAIIGTLSLSGLKYTMAGVGSSTDELYYIVSSGVITAFDYVMLGNFTINLSGLQVFHTMSIDAATSNKTTIALANGKVMETWPGGSLKLDFRDFSIDKLERFSSAGPPPAYSGSDTTLTGKIAFTIRPDGYGVEGIVSVATSTAPVHHDYTTGKTTAGQITFLGNGSATAQFNAGGDIDITVQGQLPLQIANEYYLNKVVNFYGMEKTLPQFFGASGTAATANSVGSNWPATMTVTALSSGPDLNCYTDVHVNYYDPTLTWFIDWHINDGCTNPPGIPFQQSLDLTGDHICDAGLDINGADYDITSGGVEHFTATDLPVGYYVVSINNWSCSAATTNIASIIIGDALFGTYHCTYTTSDGDGSDPGAWCRLADIRANADGTVDVLSPDPAYNPWHN